MNESKCTSCGAVLPDGAKFCENCGAKVEIVPNAVCAQAAAPDSQKAQYTAPPSSPASPDNENMYRKKYGVTGFWAFFGLIILFGLPVIGFIAAIVFSFAPENRNLKNFARAWVAVRLIGVILSAVAIGLFIGAIAAFIGAVASLDFAEIAEALSDNDFFCGFIDSFIGNTTLSSFENMAGEDAVDEIVSAINFETGRNYTYSELKVMAAARSGSSDPTMNDLAELYGYLTNSNVKTISDFIKIYAAHRPEPLAA